MPGQFVSALQTHVRRNRILSMSQLPARPPIPDRPASAPAGTLSEAFREEIERPIVHGYLPGGHYSQVNTGRRDGGAMTT